jgi:hypothetical protein
MIFLPDAMAIVFSTGATAAAVRVCGSKKCSRPVFFPSKIQAGKELAAYFHRA